MKLSEITSLNGYVDAFSADLAAKVAEQSEPLHTPSPANRHPVLATMATKLFDKQADLVTGCVRSLKVNRLAVLACQMGTGKTPQGIATVHCHANGKGYRALVICPPHLVKKWKSEIIKFIGSTVQVRIIENWQQFINLRNEKRSGQAEWFILAMTKAKLGYDKRCAAIPRVITYETDMGLQKADGFVCPKCNYPILNSKKAFASKKDIENGWLKCVGRWCRKCGVAKKHEAKVCQDCGSDLVTCGEPQWQAASHKVAPVQYLKATRVRWFDYFIRDEAHESKGCDSMDGNTTAAFASYAKYTLLLTGTLLAGKSEDIRPLLFRLKPRDFRGLGFGWKDEIPFAEQYGRIQTVVKTKDGACTKRRSGRGSSKSTTRDVKPGIMPQLFTDFVSPYTVFMSLSELAVNLPSYHEETKAVTMDGLMLAGYQELQKQCLDKFRSLYVNNRKLAVRLLGPMMEAFMTWPDVPYGRPMIGFNDDLGGFHPVYKPVDLDRNLTYPKEQALLDYIKIEKSLGRKCWVYSVRDDTRDRLQWLLEAHGYKTAMMTSAVPPADRIEWISKHAPKCDVGLSHPQLVETGLELFGPGFNFPTLLWYSTGFRLNTLRQASRRSWRIGQPADCKTVYFYYDLTAQKAAIALMAAKLVAAEAIEGKFSDGGLADENTDDDIALTVAKQLSEGITIKIQERYRPVEASQTKEDRHQILLSRFASVGAKLRAYNFKK